MATRKVTAADTANTSAKPSAAVNE